MARRRALLLLAAPAASTARPSRKEIDLDALEAQYDEDEDDADWGAAEVKTQADKNHAFIMAAAEKRMRGEWDPSWDEKIPKEWRDQCRAGVLRRAERRVPRHRADTEHARLAGGTRTSRPGRTRRPTRNRSPSNPSASTPK